MGHKIASNSKFKTTKIVEIDVIKFHSKTMKTDVIYDSGSCMLFTEIILLYEKNLAIKVFGSLSFLHPSFYPFISLYI